MVGTTRFAHTNGVGRAVYVGRASRLTCVRNNISLSLSLLELFIVIDSAIQDG